jgi:hypothetical protein
MKCKHCGCDIHRAESDLFVHTRTGSERCMTEYAEPAYEAEPERWPILRQSSFVGGINFAGSDGDFHDWLWCISQRDRFRGFWFGSDGPYCEPLRSVVFGGIEWASHVLMLPGGGVSDG